LFLTTNFVSDTHTLKLNDYSERGKGSSNMKFNLAKNTMGAHISEFPVGTYKKGHRHGPGAHVIILTGQGYSILWPEGEEMKRVDWKPGSVVVPPDRWFHQHFNSGAKPARYLALRWNNWRYRFMRSQDGEGGSFTSVKLGGGQIEFEDEDPQIHRDFEAAMKAAGARCNMGTYHPGCIVRWQGGTIMAEARQSSDLKPERIDTYRDWQGAQKIPVVKGFFVEDVNKVELVPWDLKGVPCSFVVLDGSGGVNDGYVC